MTQEELEFDEERMDIIGSNGGTGEHYSHRVCNMCNVYKSLDEFYKRGKDKYQHHCKSCAAKYKRDNKERIKKLYAKNHKKDYRKALLRAAKHRAKIKNVPFSITWEDLDLTWICPVFGTPLYTDGLNNPNAPSIDRIVPSLGYVKGNVAIISRRANALKGDASIEEVLKILAYMQQNGNDGLAYTADEYEMSRIKTLKGYRHDMIDEEEEEKPGDTGSI